MAKEMSMVIDREYQVENTKDSQRILQILEDKIYEYNSSKTNRSGGNIFSRIVRNDDGEVIAGVAGWTWAGACEITLLWVQENLRKKGLGKLLLDAAEDEARNNNCSVVLVRSYSFQAPKFYQRHGFTIEHITDNFPEGFQYYFLLKRI
jgi:GNAT superfamily N-acetyltransferase